MLKKLSKTELFEKKIIMQDLEISDLRITIDELKLALKKQLKEQESDKQKLAEDEKLIMRQKLIIGSFNGSIAYRIFRVTSAFKKTAIGKAIMRIFKLR